MKRYERGLEERMLNPVWAGIVAKARMSSCLSPPMITVVCAAGLLIQMVNQGDIHDDCNDIGDDEDDYDDDYDDDGMVIMI